MSEVQPQKVPFAEVVEEQLEQLSKSCRASQRPPGFVKPKQPVSITDLIDSDAYDVTAEFYELVQEFADLLFREYWRSDMFGGDATSYYGYPLDSGRRVYLMATGENESGYGGEISILAVSRNEDTSANELRDKDFLRLLFESGGVAFGTDRSPYLPSGGVESYLDEDALVELLYLAVTKSTLEGNNVWEQQQGDQAESLRKMYKSLVEQEKQILAKYVALRTES